MQDFIIPMYVHKKYRINMKMYLAYRSTIGKGFHVGDKHDSDVQMYVLIWIVSHRGLHI